MTEERIIGVGETFEQVYINHPGLDLQIIQEADSHVCIHVLDIYSLLGEKSPVKPVSHSIHIAQRGKGCLTEIYGLSFLHNEEQVSVDTHVHHEVGGGESKQLIKFVLDDKSKGDFYGELKIVPDAQKTEAHQTNRNLLLSDEAYIHTRPQLEIYADDVKATHGASTGQLDESALFYMQQRGLDETQARKLLIDAFMKDVIETITDEKLRNSLLSILDGETIEVD